MKVYFMKLRAVTVYLLLFFVCLNGIGCARQKPPESSNSKEAINKSMIMSTKEETEAYLLSEARAYLAYERYEDAGKIARHILARVDHDSAEAKEVLSKVQQALKVIDQEKSEELKSKVK